MHKIKKLLQDKLKQMEGLSEISAGNLDMIHKLTDTIKNIDKIEKMEGGEYSQRGMSYDGGSSYAYDEEDSYEGGSSGARRGQHYVRGHYSRDDGGGSSQRGRYSSEGDDDMGELFDEMINGVRDPRKREAIMKFKREMERM